MTRFPRVSDGPNRVDRSNFRNVVLYKISDDEQTRKISNLHISHIIHKITLFFLKWYIAYTLEWSMHLS
jgi:hypothetical protein